MLAVAAGERRRGVDDDTTESKLRSRGSIERRGHR
jgi:hypothetical protein